MNKISVIGIDLAKNVFQVHGVDAKGKPVLRKQLKRTQMKRLFTQLPPCRIGMEALCKRPLMVPYSGKLWPRGSLDGTRVRHALCEVEQE